jgi:hypothetical protein
VELYVDRGPDADTDAIFDNLLERRPAIERDLGHPLVWERTSDRRASKIVWTIASSTLTNPDSWNHVQDMMVDGVIRLDRALRPHLERVGAATG